VYPVSSGGDGVCDVVQVVMKTNVSELMFTCKIVIIYPNE
jgi:hypothetical protein